LDANTLNLIIGIGLVVALVVTGAVQLVGVATGHPIVGIEQVVTALVGILVAFRHASDVKNGNGSSGIAPKE
jgi:hypothetical protein